ncbi:hypothetical protein BKA70DRAFT_1427986 [Coprinopsis sp. MPI-PUGE-AT-0042]|nr:hypothetical protein BKA70DRAFT_1427986 [Coprinopsis sp. MPI-PUGE-AT-0042]
MAGLASGSPCTTAPPVVRLIVEHQSRWRYLSLYIEAPEFWAIHTKTPVDQWRLETLVLFHYHLYEANRPADVLIEDGKANPLNQITTLKKLVFSDKDIKLEKEIANLAHPGLMELDLIVHRMKPQYFRLLENWPNLVTLSIKIESNATTDWPNHYPQHPISLPCVKSLTVDTEDLRILSSLNCQALVNFHLNVQVSRPKRNPYGAPTIRLLPPHLGEFLSRATNTLSRVAIKDGPTSDTVLTELLGCLSLCSSGSLTVVGVDRWPSADEPTPLDWCPNLCELRIGGHVGWISLSDMEGVMRTKRFIEYLNKRLDWEGNKLKRLVVRKDPFMVSFPYDLLEPLEVKGLKVTVMPTFFTL